MSPEVISRLHTHLFQDFKGGRQRLSEHGRCVGDAGRHRVEIGDWHPHILSETASGVENAHDLPRWAVAAEPLGAAPTTATGKVNLCHHSCPHQLGWPRTDLPDKFVSRHPLEPHISAQNLQVCRTNARQTHTHHGGSLICRRCGIGRIQPQVLTIPEEGLHGGLLRSISQLQMAPQHIHVIRRIRCCLRPPENLGDGQEFATLYFFRLQD